MNYELLEPMAIILIMNYELLLIMNYELRITNYELLASDGLGIRFCTRDGMHDSTETLFSMDFGFARETV